VRVHGETVPYAKSIHLINPKVTQKRSIIYLLNIKLVVALSNSIIQALILSVRLCNSHHYL
jgi:uncharacterized membrane protein YwzB